MNTLGVIILAAGLGKRMNSDLPKVLHCLSGKSLLAYVLNAARSLKPAKMVVVVGHGAEQVMRLHDVPGLLWVRQDQQLGTGHAVRCTGDTFHDFSGELLILSGDVPLIREKTLTDLLRRHRDLGASLTVLTASMERPSGYGRILRGRSGELVGIVEERDASEKEKIITEVNAGVYLVSARFLYAALEQVTNSNQQREYYLPDIVGIALKHGEKIETFRAEDNREILGINTREELAVMEQNIRQKTNRKWMEAGVTLKDPPTTYIEEGVLIGKDTVIGPNTHLMGRTAIGARCVIDGNAYVKDARLADEVHLKFSVVLTDCELETGVEVGPFSHLRPGTLLKRGAHIGSFVEVKNSCVGEQTKANHLSYIGDAILGSETNIGAGTITCNYDGFNKHRTRIGDRVQVGSNTQLVAPVVVGDDAYIGAGSTITKDVPAGALALSRVAQKHVTDWVQRFRQKHQKDDRS